MTLAVLLSSRAGGRYLAWLIGCGLACFLCSPFGLKIDWAASRPAVVMGVPELCATLLISIGVIVLRSRLWIIDRLGSPGRRWIPSTCAALVTIGGPQLALALAATTAPRPGGWPLSATSILFLASLAVLSAPFIGALRAAGLILVLYFALTIAAQLAPAVGAWSPLAVVNWPTIEPVPPGKVALAAGTAAAAIAVTIRTLGRTMRTWGQDLDTA